MEFFCGQTVTRKTDTKWKLAIYRPGAMDSVQPIFGVVYRVTDVGEYSKFSWITLDGFQNGYDANEFRPVVSKDTSAQVEKLRRLLDPKNHEQFESA